MAGIIYEPLTRPGVRPVGDRWRNGKLTFCVDSRCSIAGSLQSLLENYCSPERGGGAKGVWSESKREHRRVKLKQKRRRRRATQLPRHVLWKRGLISKVKCFLQHLGGLHRLLYSYFITPELSLISVLWDMRAFAGKFTTVFMARQNAESIKVNPLHPHQQLPTHTSSESLHQMYLDGRVWTGAGGGGDRAVFQLLKSSSAPQQYAVWSQAWKYQVWLPGNSAVNPKYKSQDCSARTALCLKTLCGFQAACRHSGYAKTNKS